jgi:hypothetical protein
VLDLDTKAGVSLPAGGFGRFAAVLQRTGGGPPTREQRARHSRLRDLVRKRTAVGMAAMADRLIAAAQQAGLKFDVGVSRNCATLLRLPTSFNRKTVDNPLECRVLAWGSDTSLAHLGTVLKAVPARLGPQADLVGRVSTRRRSLDVLLSMGQMLPPCVPTSSTAG